MYGYLELSDADIVQEGEETSDLILYPSHLDRNGERATMLSVVEDEDEAGILLNEEKAIQLRDALTVFIEEGVSVDYH